MDGLTFLRHARLKSEAKIVILSSITTRGSDKASKARALGADAIIGKPSGTVSFDLQERKGSVLIDTIYKLLESSRGDGGVSSQPRK